VSDTSRSLVRDLYPGPSEHEAGVITTTEIAENILSDYRYLSKMWLKLHLLNDGKVFFSFVITGLLVNDDEHSPSPVLSLR
jgi:hypothetical protein